MLQILGFNLRNDGKKPNYYRQKKSLPSLISKDFPRGETPRKNSYPLPARSLPFLCMRVEFLPLNGGFLSV